MTVRGKTSQNLLLGVMVLLVGFVILAGNFGFAIPGNWHHIIFSWQMLLIAIGTFIIIQHKTKLSGYIMILIGFVFLAPKMFDINLPVQKLLVPAVLIGIGILIILRRMKIPFHDASLENSFDEIDDVSIFSGGDKLITTDNFKGGRMTSIFGGSNFNMLRAKMAPGTNVISVFSMFGGAKFVVPADWKVKIDVVSIFGGYSDKRMIMPNNGIMIEDRELVIKGLVIFGGGEIKSI
jgi:predicted membrane protein